jgi:small subunit ribosomal protein S3
MVIGRSGEGSTKIKQDIVTFMRRNKIPVPEELKIDIVEVQNPDADAHIVAFSVAEALERRLPFRRVMKQTVERVINTRGVEGVRIVLSGRLGGAEIARIEEQKRGSIPLQTFRADVDYTRERAHMTYGDIGIKVWIYRGEVFENKDGQNPTKK